MTTETTTDKPARAATRGPGFQDIIDLIAEMKAEHAAEMASAKALLASLADRLEVLSALVQSALPAALVRLSWESVQDLITGAPQTRLRLLAPFASPMMNLTAGYEMDACDSRVRTHGRGMSLGLATVKSDAPAAMVRRIIADHAAAQVHASQELARIGLQQEAEQARAHADKLTRAAGA